MIHTVSGCTNESAVDGHKPARCAGFPKKLKDQWILCFQTSRSLTSTSQMFHHVPSTFLPSRLIRRASIRIQGTLRAGGGPTNAFEETNVARHPQTCAMWCDLGRWSSGSSEWTPRAWLVPGVRPRPSGHCHRSLEHLGGDRSTG